MKTISIKKEFHEMNLSNALTIDKLKEQLNAIDYSEVTDFTIDLSGCITDYPDTPCLIDCFLNILSKQEGLKKLIIIYTGIGTNELHVLYDLVLEGTFFGIRKDTKEDNNLNDWKEKIKNTLLKHTMELTILCPLDNKEYHYAD